MFKFVGKVGDKNWVCEIYEDTVSGMDFAVCYFLGKKHKVPVMIPAVEFETCSRKVFENYPLPKPLLSKLLRECVKIKRKKMALGLEREFVEKLVRGELAKFK